MSEAFGSEIQTRRTAIGMSQARLAELVGRSTSTVRSWERGRTEPSPDALDALVAVLGMDSYDDETVIEMPAVVAGVAPESFKASDTLDDEESHGQADVPFPQAGTDEGDDVTSLIDIGAASEPVAGEVLVDAPSAINLASDPGSVIVSPEATVSFVDQPKWTVRYLVRIVATVGVLLGLAVVGRWAASGALEIVRGMMSAVRAALGF
jgi:transcriptional regulator with XRE-family HTH domain